ncbi:MAG: phosphoribosylformylglycinamidine synthase [Deltaproteobacteria bacterium]|nr:phosphoribosylformylglycinamidine synthase [Deltaproteobacteria bacterium]
MNLHRLEVAPRTDVADVQGERVARKIRSELRLPVDSVRMIKVFTIAGLDEPELQTVLDRAALHDPVLHRASLTSLASDFDYVIEVGYRPGVTDNEGRTARETLVQVLGLSPERQANLAVYTSTQYLLRGGLNPEDPNHIVSDLLANDLIQRTFIKTAGQWTDAPGFPAVAARVTGQASVRVETVALRDLSDTDLAVLSRDRVLALSVEELRAIIAHFDRPEIQARRKAQGLPTDPTDVELECLAQTWSEHCKHKIFNAAIDYEDQSVGRRETINSLYKTYIQGSTRALRERMGKKDYCLSVFKDNAGVVRFDDRISVCVKVETHNSPSALDPYGGALTGIVGVNRDPMGTGMGANLLCNTDVFCFASPFHQGELPPRLLHPRRVLEGVREGVEHGGNKSGIPTVNGALVFDHRYLGKPLVFCGTIGTIPAEVVGRPGHIKKAMPGDRIVMVGGRIGKDGIHGATFSSEELHEGSPATAVQIGDPITQRRMYDCLMRARDLGLYNAITDNGAGGLSSSVGEMAGDTGGCDLDLALAPLKYDGLAPWEILVSEAQERMTLAVSPDRLEEFMALAREMNVEATDLGRFTDDGRFLVRHGRRIVACMDMDFLHDGVPQMRLQARWNPPVIEAGPVRAMAGERDREALLQRMLSRLNICSREYLIRQYDHEVQGGSVIKPLVGVRRDGPSDAAVVRPILDSERGLAVSNGICPRYGDHDTYWMMAACIDEAVRNCVAVGADPRTLAGVDNFCWCDPVQSEKTPDGRFKLAQLVRANKALAHFCLAYGLPCVSGKDSMKNDYAGGGVKISIPPTVLFTVIGIVPDVNMAVTSDLKAPDEDLYLLGMTRDELGAGEYLAELGLGGGQVPQVDALTSRALYRALHEAMRQGLVAACHDLSDGGLAVALAEMAIAGRLGLEVDLGLVPFPGQADTPETILYSESQGRLLVSVRPQDRTQFEALFTGLPAARIGLTTARPIMTCIWRDRPILSSPVDDLARAWKRTLDF